MKCRPALCRRSRLWPLVVVALVASASAPVHAQRASLAILGLSSKDGDDEAAAELTNALREQAAADSRLSLSDSSASLAQLVVLHDCEITAAECRDAIAQQLRVGAMIYGAIRRSEGGHIVELHHYVVDDGSLSHASRELTIVGASEPDLARDARGLLRELRGADEPEQAELAPAPELAPVRRTAPRPEPEAAPEPEEQASSNDWLGYSLLGVAAVSAGLTVFAWSEIDAARTDDDFRAYRDAVGRTQTGKGVDDVCDEAAEGKPYSLGVERLEHVRDGCERGVTFEILQWVFVGSALVSAGFGIYMLLDDDGEHDAAHASLTPIVSEKDAGLLLRLQL